MLTKICSKCGKFYPASGSCCEKKRHKEYDLYRRDKESAAVYRSKEWSILTVQCKERCNGIDLYILMTEGRIVPGQLCHHIYELDEAPDRRFYINNLLYVSVKSHAAIHRIYLRDSYEKKILQKKLEKFLQIYVGR